MKTPEIKVEMNFNISKNTHTLYNSFFNNPPFGITFLKSNYSLITNKNYSVIGKVYNFLRPWLSIIFSGIHQRLNDTLRKKIDSDLIHFSCHTGVSKKPFVSDYEHAYNFVDSRLPTKKNLENARKLFNQKNMKCLMPMNNQAKKSFELVFPDMKKIKQEVVYPSIEISQRKNNQKKRRVIFIGSSNIVTDEAFLLKGGIESIMAFSSLAKKYPRYEFIVVSNVPDDIKIESSKNLIFLDVVPQKELWMLMRESSIFVQPSYITPTMAFLEAMSFALPVVTYDSWSNREYVDKKNGILIAPRDVKFTDKFNIPNIELKLFKKIKNNSKFNSLLISDAIDKLIKNPKLAKEMGENGYKKVKYGKFSIKERNKKLRKIYEDALK